MKRALDLLIDQVGDCPLATLSHATAEEFAKRLRESGRAHETRRNTCNKVSAFGGWCHKRGLLPRNVFSGMMDEKRPNRPDEDRSVLKPEEVRLVLRAVGLAGEEWKRLIPLLLLYTGCRVNEVAQLRVIDVQDDEGTPFLRLTEEAGSLKNLASRRSIPIHSAIAHEFLAYVELRRAAGAERVFPLRLGVDGYGAMVSRWWSTTREKRGFSNDATLHGLRHTFGTRLRDCGVPWDEIQVLMGHSRGQGETSRYVKPQTPKQLARVIERLSYIDR
ncbi:MAG: site-specific integrase [Betaproteobacteria bacterium]|nr:site-specific integrase [Betaproteobacteria bacterium]